MTGSIEKLADGRYEVAVRCQGGVERFLAGTADEARRGYAAAYRALNGGADPGRVPEVVDRAAWPVVATDAENRFEVPDDRLRDALRRAAAAARPGRRYELRVELAELPGGPAYEGAGI